MKIINRQAFCSRLQKNKKGDFFMIENAIKKLTDENEKFKGGSHESAMRQAIFDTLCAFCRQEPEFAQAVLQSDGTLSDCLKAVAKGVGGSISDLEAYKKAVCFYFPGADVRCVMTIDLIGDAGKSGKKISALEMSLDELF